MPAAVGFLPARPYQKKFPSPTPVKFHDPEAVENGIDAYFDSLSYSEVIQVADPNDPGQTIQKIKTTWIEHPTVVGLANFLGCDYNTLLNMGSDHYKYSEDTELTPQLRKILLRSISRAKQIIHQYTAQTMLSAKSAQGYIFVLKNNFGWRDEQHITQDLTTKTAETDLSKLSTEQLTQLQSLVSLTQAQDAEYSDISDQDSQDSGDNLWD
jgi:hypothetical protein